MAFQSIGAAQLSGNPLGRTSNRSQSLVLFSCHAKAYGKTSRTTIATSTFGFGVDRKRPIGVIAQTLLAALRTHFPNRELVLGTPPNPIIIIPAQHPAVGTISIWDDGEEVTLAIGDITHGHFSGYNTSNAEELAQAVVEQVIAFLDALFTDCVLLWKTDSRGAGGWHVLDPGHPFTDQLPAVASCFVWSGPKALDAILAGMPANKLR